MKETIKMTGRLLLFDKKDLMDLIFPKDCEITFPEKVPVIHNFQIDNPGAVIGNATVTKDKYGLVCDAELINFDPTVLHDYFQDELYIGGYYDHVKMHQKDGVMVIEKARLLGISTTFAPADFDLKMTIKEEYFNWKLGL